MSDLWSRLEQLLSDKVDPEYANIAANTLRERQAINPKNTLSDFGFGPQHGLNVVAQPDMYFPNRFKENTKIENLGYTTGGEYSLLGGVKLNINSIFDHTGSATHEAQHWKTMASPQPSRLNLKYSSKEDVANNTESDKNILNAIKEKLISYRENGIRNLRNRRILSGQDESGEIIPQLRSYESMLPAGMSLFQSPLGKELFKSNDERLWYLNQIQPSMSDQSYLDEILERDKKRK